VSVKSLSVIREAGLEVHGELPSGVWASYDELVRALLFDDTVTVVGLFVGCFAFGSMKYDLRPIVPDAPLRPRRSDGGLYSYVRISSANCRVVALAENEDVK
jgi:hypothetical protein